MKAVDQIEFLKEIVDCSENNIVFQSTLLLTKVLNYKQEDKN